MSFSELGLAEPLLRAIAEQGYATPTPIQQQGIPAVLSGRDLMAAAQTGTGKTAGFTLPMLHRLMEGKRPASNHIRALVLTPTRELAAQVGESVRDYGAHLPLASTIVFGGVSINPQMMALRKGVDVLVATPGRLLDLYEQNAVKFSQVEMLVLDEADRMLDMGFIRDIRKILALLPKRRQNLLFSATFSDDITALAKGLLHDPLQVSVSPRNAAANTVKQSVYLIDKARKTALLSHLVRDNQWEQVLVFTRTKHGANRLAEKLARDGVTAAAIHGNKSQGARTKALADFKQNNIRVLVATDIAARGIDIDQLPHVVNFELPNVSEDYVHRIGRTGRAGASGEAISLVEPEEHKYLKGIEKLIKQTLPREELPAISAAPERPRTEAKTADAEADKPGKPQHRPKKRRTRSQKNEARVAAGLPPVKRNDGNANNKPRRRRPSKPKAVA
ncbi:DEAD/DEAH box helicase [Thiothrix nivea]|uniref:ATP-dependent RNA helicase RhlE n=1 Tax=Thiothrix nivea (strain ATCC 35100 / DSM 5205 / JP2) TaxID=870187 RepID=A0A656HKX9_THINJ|nr:DEAD/DEAH box helicase [Thiothrix nivea]EIJ36943.1 DEAD/DEAH box helicase domain protein [Thiothrix nivea DSM 5205]